ncbi:PREDICTED: origin recognition complex subunit 1 [Eufriesea mexicana]|uniref:origin recognition complex subunit 1 n=1 Tax=Eufriesea mexicana TaxID=516756 RepID=UPI00083C6552|nr:PREDICTED: origin recognition complex subunit 1 [Eufriesea mexicana]
MSEDLISKEKKFHQLNKELKQKAYNLVAKIDYAVNTYNNECSVFNSRKYNNVNLTKEKTVFSNSIMMQTESNFKVLVKQNSSLPQIFDQFSTLKSTLESKKDNENEVFKERNLANKTVLNFLKAKIDILHNELQSMQIEYKKKCDICKNLDSENKKVEIKLKAEIESLKEIITKLENTNKELQCQSQTLNTENLTLKKDLDKLQKQMKIIDHQSNSYITRLNRSLENNDKLKNALKNFEVEEKELKTQIRKLQEDKKLTINYLGKQLSELIQVFKKQMLIVDNLKKQNACLVAVGQLKLTKEDFSRLLDQKPENL